MFDGTASSILLLRGAEKISSIGFECKSIRGLSLQRTFSKSNQEPIFVRMKLRKMLPNDDKMMPPNLIFAMNVRNCKVRLTIEDEKEKEGQLGIPQNRFSIFIDKLPI